MRCIHCYKELLDLYYSFNKNGNKLLIGRCSCRKGKVFMPVIDNLAIPTKEFIYAKEERKLRNSPKIEVNQQKTLF